MTEQQCVFLHHVIYHTKLSRGDGGTYTTAVAGGPFKQSGSGYLFYMLIIFFPFRIYICHIYVYQIYVYIYIALLGM